MRFSGFLAAVETTGIDLANDRLPNARESVLYPVAFTAKWFHLRKWKPSHTHIVSWLA
jgi:hypothetical protein